MIDRVHRRGDAMKLRKPCEHGKYDEHDSANHLHRYVLCPGGVFLPDDTLIIEKGIRGWPGSVLRLPNASDLSDRGELPYVNVRDMELLLDALLALSDQDRQPAPAHRRALSVREAE